MTSATEVNGLDSQGEVVAMAGPSFDLDAQWQLSPQVSIRPERFGAMVYHYGTRRLSFCKSPILATVIQSLAESPSARTACLEAGVSSNELPGYTAALERLASSGTIVPKQSA